MGEAWRIVLGGLIIISAVVPNLSADPLLLPAGAGPARLAWVRQDRIELVSVLLPGEVDLAPGHGCLVLAVSGLPVQWRELSLPEEAPIVADLLTPAPGARVEGAVRTRDLQAFIPTVEAVPLGASISESCSRGIAALGVLQTQVDWHGRFELGSLAAGRWRILFKAQHHREVTKEIEIGGREGTLEIGEIDLAPIAVTRVRVESETESPPYTLRVEEGERSSKQEDWRFLRPRDYTMDAVEAEFEFDPGTYRFTLTKPDLDLGLTVEADLRPGEQELVLRPVPLTIEGKVLRGERGIAGARLVVVRDGSTTEVESGFSGAFTLRLWAPGMYVVEASPPDGEMEIVLLDAREGKKGEVLNRDILLGSRLLSGMVVGAPDGAPLPLADVVVIQEGGGRRYAASYTTEDDGSFRVYLKDDMNVEVSASARGYLSRTVALGKNPDSSPITVSLERGVEVVGQVVGATGTPIPGALVVGFTPGPEVQPSCSTVADATGRFAFTCPSESVIFAVAAGHALGWVIASEQEVLLSLSAQGPPSRVHIATADGEPAVGARLAFQKMDGVWIPFYLVFRASMAMGFPATTAEDGGLNLSFLPPGRYNAFLVARTGVFPLGVVLLPSTAPLTFKLPPRPPG